MSKVITGLERLLAAPAKYLKGKRLGLAANHTSVAGDLRHSIQHFQQMEGFELRRIYAPEHGLYGVDQDMVGVDHGQDPFSGLPVLSLYGHDANSLTPDRDAMAGLDALVFDIQDIGSRYYTFIYTLANCMQTCGEAGIPVIVCDRPNPINGVQVEGNRVSEGYYSFVGQYPLCNRHGMTVGELALMFRDHFGIRCELTVIGMTGWRRAMWYDQTGLPWVGPSPNMPTLLTAAVYPGMCLVEGTQLSEGRGTTLPFELTGGPGIDPADLAAALNAEHLPGIVFRPHFFKPMFQKCAGETCGGVQLHLTDRDAFKPLLTGIAVLATIARRFPEAFAWRTQAYEFVSDRAAIDLLYGNPEFRTRLIESTPLAEIEASWEPDWEEFLGLRRDFLMYE